MAAMLKKALAVVASVLLSGSLFAADPALRPDHPETYVVRHGDTLWDISARFLRSPWLWPEIWQANPQIDNPHLIYPGDVISLVYIDGRPHLVVEPSGESKLGPEVRRESLDEAVKPVPLADIRQFLERPRLLTKEEIDQAPYIVGLESDRIIGATGELAYVRNLGDAQVGDRFMVARPSLEYTDVPENLVWNREDRKTRTHPWHKGSGELFGGERHWAFIDWVYEKSGESLGYEVIVIGTASVSKLGDPATLYAIYNDIEIRKGDLLVPYQELEFDLEYVPHAPPSVPDNMRVVAFTGPLNAVGPREVIVLNRGQRDGVGNGQVYSIYQPGERIVDDIMYPKSSFKKLFNPRDSKVTLPAEYIGHVMIFRTFDKLSYGLVMDAVKPTHLLDELRMPVER